MPPSDCILFVFGEHRLFESAELQFYKYTYYSPNIFLDRCALLELRGPSSGKITHQELVRSWTCQVNSPVYFGLPFFLHYFSHIGILLVESSSFSAWGLGTGPSKHVLSGQTFGPKLNERKQTNKST